MHYIMKVSRHRNQVEGDPLAKDKILWTLRIISNGLKTHQFKIKQWLYLKGWHGVNYLHQTLKKIYPAFAVWTVLQKNQVLRSSLCILEKLCAEEIRKPTLLQSLMNYVSNDHQWIFHHKVKNWWWTWSHTEGSGYKT